MTADPIVRNTVAIGDPNAPTNVIKPLADGSINVNTGGGSTQHVIIDSPAVALDVSLTQAQQTHGGTVGNSVYIVDPSTGNPITYTQATTVQGADASGAAVTGAPILDGGRAATANPAAVADGQAVAAMRDKVGREAVVPFAVRDLVSDQTTAAIVDTTVTTIVTAGTTVFNDIIGFVFSNSGTATLATIKDDTTARMTFYLPATDTRGIVFAAPFKQAAVNKNWTITCTGTPSVIVTTQFVKNI